MQLKDIDLLDEITDIYNDTIDVGVELADGTCYTICVATPQYFVEKMKDEKTDYIEPGSPTIIVKKLTEEVVRDAIGAYAENDAYWLKLYQFANVIDISILNKIQYEDRKEWEKEWED